ARARRRARVVRGSRALGAVSVFAALAVLVPLAPGWVEQQRPGGVGDALDVVEVSTECRPRTASGLNHGDFLLGEAAWARFCGVGRYYPVDIGSALVPDVALTEGAASLVRGWQEIRPRSGPCRTTPSATKFSVQVGFDDGTVTELYGETSACPAFVRRSPGYRVVPGGQVYRELMSAIAAQESGAPTGPTTGLTCPTDPPGVTGPRARRLETDLVVTGVAAAVLCSYDPAYGAAPVQAELRPAEGERVRVLALGAFDPEPPACTGDPLARSYVALLAGHDGATHAVTLDGTRCGALAIDGERLGTSPALTTALARLAASAGTAAGTVTER
uniref:hypothetical protein n=1 Tax=Nocardioides sp. SYSU DS0663 TaxID=3416445 RepID=UPI003F4BA4F2